MKLKGLLSSTTVADRLLLSILIVLSLSGIIFIKEVLPKGQTVKIDVDGHPLYLLPIEKDVKVSVEGPEGKTIVEIKDRKIRIAESPCLNRLCIKQGWIKRGAIVCLPNRVVVTVGDENDDERKKIVDAITG
ncbi:MAG: NusG domain II-containing protein [Nitrospirota bacterium]